MASGATAGEREKGSVYHQRPGDMVGEALHPLNTLRTLHPAIYERQIAKYRDHPSRVGLPARAVPKLNCLWNDVVQCAPVHPHLLYRALMERGLRANPAAAWFQIPLSVLGDLPVAIFHGSGRDDVTAPLRDEEIAWLDRERYRELDAVPPKTLAWYDGLAARGRVFGLFVGVPHVLVRGPIDVSRARVIRWGEPPAAA